MVLLGEIGHEEGSRRNGELKAFNIALLRKPESLVARLIKARYFPRIEFLNSVLGHNPSYIWWSI